MSDEPIPFSGLASRIHFPIFAIAWPLIGSFLAILIFPRFGIPLFLKLKSILWKKYKNAYIEINYIPMTFKTFFSRSLFVFLFSMGLQGLLTPIVDYSIFMGSQSYTDSLLYNYPLYYSLDVLAGISFLLIPFIVGIWSIGWMLEDSGLIHYFVPEDEEDDFYEIEPIHFKYNSYLGGFAGITALFYYIGAISFYFFEKNEPLDLFWSIFVFIVTIFLVGPIYLIYSRLNKDFPHKNLKKMKKIDINALKFEE